MRKKIVFLLVAIFLMTLTTEAFGQRVERISFNRGATSKIVTGYLRSARASKIYVIRVRRGQTLRVSQLESSGSLRTVTLNIESPTGEDVSDMDASCNNRKEVSPTRRGDYRITVNVCTKVDPWRGRFRLRVLVR